MQSLNNRAQLFCKIQQLFISAYGPRFEPKTFQFNKQFAEELLESSSGYNSNAVISDYLLFRSKINLTFFRNRLREVDPTNPPTATSTNEHFLERFLINYQKDLASKLGRNKFFF